MNYYFNSWFHRARNIGLSTNTIALIVLLSLVSTLTEVLGIGIFLPVFQFIKLEGDMEALVSDSIIWQYLVNVFDYFSFEPSLLILLLISFSFFLGRQLFIYIRVVYTSAVTERLIQTQRNYLFDRYIEADTSYHDNTSVGSLVNIIITEVNTAVSAVMAPMGLIVFSTMLIGYLCLLFILSWEMTIAAIIVLSAASMVPRIWIKKSTETGRKIVSANTVMSEFLVGRLKSPRLARLSGTENAEKKEFQKLTLSQRKHQVFKNILKAKTTVMMDPVAIGLSLSFLYFSYTMLQLQMEVIGLYLVVALRLMPIVQSILTQIQAIQGSLGSVEALETRFNAMKKSVEKDMGKISLNALKQSISFNNVFFCYQAGLNDSLKNINIEFNVNEITAVVGPSGSGKSTLIDLLPRLRSPTKGFIHVDGVNINNFTLRSVRQLISYAPQFPQIFNGTVKSHILYGKINATNEEVLEAAHLAGAESFIDKLPNGFDTILGDDAVKLSGGQRQRLDVARALVRKAPILIFDEPTSNLDAESEEIFKQVLGEIRKETNTTIIIVSHRLASIIDADKIIVLNQGKVEMSGVHSKLLSQDGWYAKAWNAQLSK